ncbi:hypothetical protein FZX09_06685 [Synechococcus sp. MU1643]|uniref:virulence-associated E family protein n=1 Tax=Synechococcus sp. MU1643 TaxID=2508349 RepID=UPI001CF892AF|nr:virulence-associated E family protein [Synechococcus sp. MU1643]MCB4428486.1 hypothetical protein [Synechococcus sp. MU1643]
MSFNASEIQVRSPIQCRNLILEMYKDENGKSRLRFNEMRGDIELDGRLLPEKKAKRIYFELDEQKGVIASRALAYDALQEAAHQYSYHPVREYLLGLEARHAEGVLEPADLSSIVATFLRPGEVSEYEELYSAYMERWLIAFVARQFDPGCKYDYLVALQGSGGGRKSSFWQTIVGRGWITDSISLPPNGEPTAKVLQTIHQFAAAELAELGKRVAGRFEATDGVKRFISAQRDDFVRQYGQESETHERGFVLCGTINDSHNFLSDPTGNRRYQIIPTTRTRAEPIDTDRLAEERDSILLAAVLAYREGASLDLPAHLVNLADDDNARYLQEVAMLKETSQFCSNPQREWFTLDELWSEVWQGDRTTAEKNKGQMGRTIAQIPWVKPGQKIPARLCPGGIRLPGYWINHELRTKLINEEMDKLGNLF